MILTMNMFDVNDHYHHDAVVNMLKMMIIVMFFMTMMTDNDDDYGNVDDHWCLNCWLDMYAIRDSPPNYLLLFLIEVCIITLMSNLIGFVDDDNAGDFYKNIVQPQIGFCSYFLHYDKLDDKNWWWYLLDVIIY